MKNLFFFLFFVLFCAQLHAQTVSQVRNQSVNPTYTPDGTTANPPLCFNRSNHTFWGYAGGTWYKISATTNVDLDPDPANEKIVSVAVDPLANVLRINEAGSFFNVPINSIIAEASISSGSSTILVSNVAGVVTISSTDPDENATNECNTNIAVSSGNLQVSDNCGTLSVPVLQISPVQSLSGGTGITVANNGSGAYTVTNTGDTSPTNECNTGVLVRNDSLIVSDNCGEVGLPLADISPDLCTQIQSLPIGTPSGGEKVIYFGSSVPSNFVGFDFDNVNDFGCTGGDPTTTYLHDMQYSGGSIPLTTPAALTDVITIQNHINTVLIPQLNIALSLSLAPNDIIWQYNVGNNTVTVWYNPTISLYPNNFLIGDIISVCKKPIPQIPTTQTPGAACFLGDAPSAPAGWLLKGNAGTDGGATDFLGTTDAVDLVLKTNNIPILKMDTNGNITANDVTNNASSGNNSFACGQETAAIGQFSFAANYQTGATGYASASFNQSSATGDAAFAANLGLAYGSNSAAIGEVTTAHGTASFTAGGYTTATSIYETAVGAYNVPLTPYSPTGWDSRDAIFVIGGGQIGTPKNIATIWKDGRAVMNTDATNTTPIQNTWFGINGTLAQNFNHIRTNNTLAAFSTEHTPSGNYAVLGSIAGNSGLAINNTKQFAFTTTAGTSSTNLGATTTIGNYSNSGFAFGGGAVATSTIDVQGSTAVNTLDVAADITLTAVHTAIVCNNGAANITITLPTASTCRGRIYMISRGAGSTGSVTITPTGSQVQELAGTLGATTTLSALGAYGQHVIFQSNGTAWYRKN